MSDARFVFGVDLDGCAADLCEGYRRSFAGQLGVSPDVFGEVTDFHFECWRPYVRDGAHYRELHAVAVTDGIFASVPVIPGAVDGLRELSSAGVFIRLITHRTGPDQTQVVIDTATWLRANRVPFDGLCFEGHKSEIGADIYLDDAPHQVAGYVAAGQAVIAYGHPYNRDLTVPRATSWDQVVEMVLAEKASKASKVAA
jgi:5'-nucleotidase